MKTAVGTEDRGEGRTVHTPDLADNDDFRTWARQNLDLSDKEMRPGCYAGEGTGNCRSCVRYQAHCPWGR